MALDINYNNNLPENTPFRAHLTEVPMTGEPATDKLFQCAEDGKQYRVRVLPFSERTTTTGGVVTDVMNALDLTITRRNADGTIALNASGQPIIVAATRITVDAMMMGAPGGEAVTTSLQRTIEEYVFRAMKLGQNETEFATMMATWGAKTGVGLSVATTATGAVANVKLGK